MRFALTAPRAGTLEITVTTPVDDFDIDIVGPNGIFAAYYPYPHPARSPRVSIPVSGGSTYEIRLTGAAPHDFELSTALR